MRAEEKPTFDEGGPSLVGTSGEGGEGDIVKAPVKAGRG